MFIHVSNDDARGIKTSDTASDIKKAYRRAALKHHPDKVLIFFPYKFTMYLHTFLTSINSCFGFSHSTFVFFS